MWYYVRQGVVVNWHDDLNKTFIIFLFRDGFVFLVNTLFSHISSLFSCCLRDDNNKELLYIPYYSVSQICFLYKFYVGGINSFCNIIAIYYNSLYCSKNCTFWRLVGHVALTWSVPAYEISRPALVSLHV